MLIEVKVRPNSKDDRIVKINPPQSIEVELRAKPENNQANERLLSFLTKMLKLPKNSLKIIRGHTERKKLIKIDGVDEESFWKIIKEE